MRTKRHGLAAALLTVAGGMECWAVQAQSTPDAGKATAASVKAEAKGEPKAGAKAEVKAGAAKAAPAAAKPPSNDIVLDGNGASAVAPAGGGMLVPTPGVSAPDSPPPSAPLRRPIGAAHAASHAGALAELGLDLLREQSKVSGNAQVNAVLSPFSLVSALGMVHAGAAGASATELARLLGTPAIGQRYYTTHLPAVLDSLAKPGAKPGPFVMANRVWLDSSVLTDVPRTYAAAVRDRYNADAALLAFAQAGPARQAINVWVAQATSQRIQELMPEGSIDANTRLVVTNAIHFKSKWAQPFNPAATQSKPFFVGPGAAAKSVPTMVDERDVRIGTVDNVTVMELPFAGNEFSLLIGMPAAGHTLNAFETDLEGLDIAGWSAQLKTTTCRVELPRFSIAPVSRPLKTSLQALGVRTAFGPQADFTPMLGKAAAGVALDNVYQSATIDIDEEGGEASAATGAAVQAKSFNAPAPACAVDRPFVFVVVHRASGAPLFLGKVADPSRH